MTIFKRAGMPGSTQFYSHQTQTQRCCCTLLLHVRPTAMKITRRSAFTCVRVLPFNSCVSALLYLSAMSNIVGKKEEVHCPPRARAFAHNRDIIVCRSRLTTCKNATGLTPRGRRAGADGDEQHHGRSRGGRRAHRPRLRVRAARAIRDVGGLSRSPRRPRRWRRSV